MEERGPEWRGEDENWRGCDWNCIGEEGREHDLI